MAGLKILYNLILKDAARGSGQASGILSIGKDIRKLADKKLQRYITAAQKQGVDLDKLSEQEIKYMLELNKPNGPTIGGHQIIDASSPEGQGITRDLFNMLDRQSGKNVIKADFGKPFAEETGSVDNIIKNIKTMKPMDSMKETNKVLRGEGKYKNLSKADREKIAGDESVTDHIFERNIEPDPEDFAGGGVAGMLGEPTYQDEEHRVPYGGGGTGKPPITFNITGGGSYGEDENIQDMGQTIPGLNQQQYNYNLNLGAEMKLPWNLTATGNVGIGRGSTKTDYKGQPVDRLSGVGETKLGDQWNVGLKWSKKFNEGGRVPYSKGSSSEVLPADFDELEPEELIYIIKLLKAGEIPQYALGGRAGYKDGKGPKMSRRNFLKIMGGLAALPVVGKFFKFAKPAAKVADLTQIPIKNAEGMPSWFKPLVNRVIKEGTETTNLAPNKGGAFLDRQIVHSAKLGEGQGVRVYQSLDDQTIRVEYQSADNMGGVDDGIVQLEYTAPQVIEPPIVKGGKLSGYGKGVKTKAEFSASEAYPYQDPKDYKSITFEGDNTVKNVDGLYSDTSALKQFGTNKTLSKKELEIAKQKQKQVKKINENPSEELGPLDESSYDPNDFASGGLAHMVGE